MTKTIKSSWDALLAFALIPLACLSTIALAQTPNATPTPDKRGIGIQSTGSTSKTQAGQQSREAKPELVLQTGYNNFLGATRLVFSPDGRLLATGDVSQQHHQALGDCNRPRVAQLVERHPKRDGHVSLYRFQPRQSSNRSRRRRQLCKNLGCDERARTANTRRETQGSIIFLDRRLLHRFYCGRSRSDD